MPNNYLILFASIFILLPSIGLSEPSWELKKSENGIDVYTADKPGSKYNSFKAVTTLNVNSEEIVKALKDVKAYINWFAYTKTSKLLKTRAHERDIYMETRFPWPFKNEDMVYKMTFTETDKLSTKVQLEGIPYYLPPLEGINRMIDSEGYILLEKVGSKTVLTYLMHSELSGDIPAWMANQYIFELPFRTLNNLKNIFLEQKYYQPMFQ